jgi:ATP-dependent helicase/nuclease subunit B
LLAHERYLAYVVCTRASERLVLTSAYFDSLGRALNPSPFLGELQRLFPGFEAKDWRMPDGWEEVEHPAEAVPRLIQLDPSSFVAALPLFRNLRGRLAKFSPNRTDERLSSAVAQKLYGPELRTSITRLERFGECQFRFFVTEGLHASEKRTFELDRRKLGDFQHQVLKGFHLRLQSEKKRWRDLTPREARELMGQIARDHAKQYHNGLFMADEQDRFAGEQLSLALEDMIEVLVGWMDRYEFDPTAVELRFDDKGAIPPLRLPLSGGRSLALNGSIDRVDILPTSDNSEAWCLVIDYKSSNRRLDPLLMHHGIQMQLPAYLAVLQNLDSPEAIFGVKKLLPAGLFYISLRRDNSPKANRNELFADPEANRKAAYRHYGRFNAELLDHLDNAASDAGEQFNYRRKRDGEFYKNSLDPIPPQEFVRLTKSTVARLKAFGEAVFRGETDINPFSHRKDKACDRCDYRPICRIDLLTHTFRPLQAAPSHAS